MQRFVNRRNLPHTRQVKAHSSHMTRYWNRSYKLLIATYKEVTNKFNIHMPVHRNIFTNYSQQDATFLEFIYLYRRSTCFRRFLRPSLGAHNWTYSFRFEVRHPRCVSQITKLYSKRLKSKHNYTLLVKVDVGIEIVQFPLQVFISVDIVVFWPQASAV